MQGPPGGQGGQGNPGAPGAPGANGTAVAYAHVFSSGTLDTANSKNVEAATRPQTGGYCLRITVPVTNASATVDMGNSGGFFGYAAAAISGEDTTGVIGALCSGLAGANAFVNTANINGTPTNMGSWITLN